MTWTSILLIIINVVLAAPLAAGFVKQNRVYGYRTPATLQDVEVWHSYNQCAGLIMLAATAVSTLVVLAIPWKSPPTVLVWSGQIAILSMSPVLLAFVLTPLLANR